MRVNLIGYASTLGYGNCTMEILKSLVDEGIEVALFPIGGYVEVEERTIPYVQAAIKNSIDYDENAPTLRIAEQFNMSDWVGSGRRYGLSFFELDRVTDEEFISMNNADVIFTPSSWAAGIIKNDIRFHGKPIHVTPMGVDREIFKSKYDNIPRFGVNDAVTTFINVGKFELRKGHDCVVNAFNAAFSPGDAVQMIMICDNPFIGEGNSQWRRSISTTRMGASFIFKNRLPDQQTLAMILAEADAGFFPARAEGWNLDLLECLSVGLPVVATNYSGQTEYLTGDNARLIEIDELEDAKDGIFFHGGKGNWAKLGNRQLEQAIYHLREIHRQKQLGCLGGNRNGVETARRFSWQNTARQIIEGLKS